MASAEIRLIQGRSWSGRGYHFKTPGDTKIVTNESDVAFFEGNPRFGVKLMKGVASAPTPAAKTSKAAPQPEAASTTEDGPLPWKGNMKKVDLVAAAISRDIAVTDEDKVATIVQLLREWDDENGS